MQRKDPQFALIHVNAVLESENIPCLFYIEALIAKNQAKLLADSGALHDCLSLACA